MSNLAAVIREVIRGPVRGPIRGSSAFSPVSMFGSGEQGWVYDLSDLSTLFQDHTGITPVTAVGQPVGMVLDKRKGLVKEQRPTTGWVKSSGDGVVTVVGNLITITGATTQTRVIPAVFRTVKPGLTIVTAKYTNTGGATSPLIYAAGTPVAPISGASKTVHALSINSNNDSVQISSGSATFLIEEYYELPGNHKYQATAGKRGVLQVDANGKYYIKRDGIDDFEQTANINFTGTDKISQWIGVRKLDDTARIIAELSANWTSNNGAFAVESAGSYSSGSRGAAAHNANQVATIVQAGADTAVLTITHDIAGDLSTIARNGVVGTSGTGDKGSGNFGNSPMFFGARGGTSLFHNGHEYSQICLGRLPVGDESANCAAWVEERTGALI